MPLTLTTPLISMITSYRIDEIHINMESNTITTLLAQLDDNNNELLHKEWTMKICDDIGNIIMPSSWPEANPSGAQMYSLIQHFIFLMLQDLPGENGLGPGVIT